MYICIILLIIAALCIWSVILDFSRFTDMDYTYDIFPSAVLKRINVVLAAMIAFAVGKDGLSPGDSRRMKAALLFACLGEALFAMRHMHTGILMFAVCQILLIIRNGTGIAGSLKDADNKQKIELIIPGMILMLILTAFPVLPGSFFKYNCTYIIVYLYGIILCTSLWTAVASHILKLLPVKNSRMAACGMLCFFFCDVLVGLDAFLEPGLPWLLANSFIWVFYIPALVLLALSCYRFI